MLPLAWYRLLKQAGYPDLVAFTGTAPGGPPSLGGGARGSQEAGGRAPRRLPPCPRTYMQDCLATLCLSCLTPSVAVAECGRRVVVSVNIAYYC